MKSLEICPARAAVTVLADGAVETFVVFQERPAGAQKADDIQPVRNFRDQREDFRPRRAETRPERRDTRQIVEEAIPEKMRGILIGHRGGEQLHRPATDDKAAILSVDIRQDGFGGDDVFKSGIHVDLH